MKWAEDETIEALRRGVTPSQLREELKEKQPTLDSDYYSSAFGLEFLISGDPDDLRSGEVRAKTIAFLRRVAIEVPVFAERVAKLPDA